MQTEEETRKAAETLAADRGKRLVEIGAQLDRLTKAAAVVTAGVQALNVELEQARAIVSLDRTPKIVTRDTIAAWVRLWSVKHPGVKYFVSQKDVGLLRTLVKKLGEAEVLARMESFLVKKDPIFLNASHSVGMFSATINQHAGLVRQTQDMPPVGCQHRPPCVTDTEHTSRYMRDLTREGA